MLEYMAAGLPMGAMLGLSFRLFLGPKSNPCRSRQGTKTMVGSVVGSWWVITYPVGQPVVGSYIGGVCMGYLAGQAIGVIIEIIRGDGDGDGGGRWWRRGPWDDDSPGPRGPGPSDRKPEDAPSVVTAASSLTMEHFAKECSDHPAPAEPSPLIPAGR